MSNTSQCFHNTLHIMRKSHIRVAQSDNTTQVRFVSTKSTRGPRMRQVPVRRTSPVIPKHKKARSRLATVEDELDDVSYADMGNHEFLHMITDIEASSTKVFSPCHYQRSTADISQTPQDYIREWLPKKQMYLGALLAAEVPHSFACHQCGISGTWKCRDCLFTPIFCADCCRQSHLLHPFHRIDHWTGSHFEPAWLFHVGVVLQLGHGGRPCPSYVDSSVPEPHFHESPADEDEVDDVTESDVNNNIVKELKRLTGVYDLSSGAYSLPVDCHELTVVDVSGVHRVWVRWCNCPNSRQEQERHLLQMSLFPVSYKNIKSAFTFKVLDDFRMSNLECKCSAWQYYQKLRHLTSPMFPNAVDICKHII